MEKVKADLKKIKRKTITPIYFGEHEEIERKMLFGQFTKFIVQNHFGH